MQRTKAKREQKEQRSKETRKNFITVRFVISHKLVSCQ